MYQSIKLYVFIDKSILFLFIHLYSGCLSHEYINQVTNIVHINVFTIVKDN